MVRVRSRTSACEIYGVQGCTGTGFFLQHSVSPVSIPCCVEQDKTGEGGTVTLEQCSLSRWRALGALLSTWTFFV
jgi:hypothetical protein